MVEIYNDFYDGIDNKLNIFDSLNAPISISVAEDVVEQNSNNFIIDNNNTEDIFPKVIMGFPNITAGDTIISNSDYSVTASEAISGDELILDFDKQIYELDGVSCIDKIDFVGGLFRITENSTVEITTIKECNLEYYTYPEVQRERFVESFHVTGELVYDKNNNLVDEDYGFRMNAMTVDDRDLLDDIRSNKFLRIKFEKVSMDTGNSEYRYLSKARFIDWDEGFTQSGDIIAHNITGEAEKLF